MALYSVPVKKDGYIYGGLFLFLSFLSAFILLNFPRHYVYIFPGIALSALIIALFFSKPTYFIYAYFLSFILFLQDVPGIQVTDIIFFTLTMIFVFFYFIPYLVTGRAEIETNIDKWYLLFIICLGFGFIDGLIVSQDKIFAFSDMTFFIGTLLYFPFRYHFKSKKFRQVIFVILVIICSFVLIRNFLNYREIIIQSNISWKVKSARVPQNEIIILLGTVLSLLAYAYHPNKLLKLLFLLIFSVFIAGLILTESRGYWIAFAITLVIIITLSDRSGKKYILGGIFVLGTVGIIIASLFFSYTFHLVVKGLTIRLESISTLSETSRLGPSLLERVYETKTIVAKLLHNPIVGYGMGTQYQRYYILFESYLSTTFIHNGYLAIWFKTGIVGLLAIVSFCLTILRKLLQIYRLTNINFLKFISLASFSLLSGMLILNVTSPQFFEFDSMTLIILIGVFASYYSSHGDSLIKKPSEN